MQSSVRGSSMASTFQERYASNCASVVDFMFSNTDGAMMRWMWWRGGIRGVSAFDVMCQA